MKKELNHFHIGSSYGGNQDWFRTFMMRIGGCGAETACDSSLYFAIQKALPEIYPFDAGSLSREDYVEFAEDAAEFKKSHKDDIVDFSGEHGPLPEKVDEIVAATDATEDYVGRYYTAIVAIKDKCYLAHKSVQWASLYPDFSFVLTWQITIVPV